MRHITSLVIATLSISLTAICGCQKQDEQVKWGCPQDCIHNPSFLPAYSGKAVHGLISEDQCLPPDLSNSPAGFRSDAMVVYLPRGQEPSPMNYERVGCK